MVCPACGAEYRPGFFRCADCDVFLVHEQPPRLPDAPRDLDAPADDVVVFRSRVPGETEMIAAALAEEGIEGILQRGIAGGLQLHLLDGGYTPGQEWVLAVPSLAASRAREIIESLRPEDAGDSLAVDLPPDELPGPTGPSQAAKSVARLLLFLALVPFAIGVLALLGAIVQ